MSQLRPSDRFSIATKRRYSRWLAALFRGSRKRQRAATRIEPALECLENRLLLTHGPVEIHQSADFSEPKVVTDSVTRPSFVTTADMDGDGDLDVVVSSYVIDEIRWSENLGNGMFVDHLISDRLDPSEVQVFDLDRDGDMDVVVTSNSDDTVAWLENDGQENFAEHIITTNLPSARTVSVADMDGDGDFDVVAGGGSQATGNEVYWYENDGSENFAATAITANSGYAIFLSDLDNDGDIDVISSSIDSRHVHWLENDGDGQFTERTVIASTAGHVVNVKAIDMDADGDVDIVPTQFNASLAWYKNDGNQVFSEVAVPRRPGFSSSQTAVAPADLDGDGDADLLVGSFGVSHLLTWLENDGSANFTEHVVRLDNGQLRDAVAADLDNDGDLDVLSASGDDNGVVWHKNRGGQFSLLTDRIIGRIDDGRRTISESTVGASDVFSIDVDGDGDEDILSSATDGTIAWHENDGSQNFTQRAMSTNIGFSNSVVGADFDNDGDIDVIASSDFTRALVGFRNDGIQSFTSFSIPHTAPTSGALFAIDIDGDSDIDLLSTALDNIYWYENDGNASFTEHVFAAPTFNVSLVKATDLDGDGDIDIVAASVVANRIFWLKNDGSQGFTTHDIAMSEFGITDFSTADVDGDGDIDIISAFGDNVAWYENDGNEIFQRQIVDASEKNPNSILAADIDGDGDTDLAVSSNFGHQAFWYENNGAETFEKHVVDPRRVGGRTAAHVAQRHGSIFANDIDGDGDLDLLSTSYLNDSVYWYENFGDGNFSFEPTADVDPGTTVGVLKIALTHEGLPGDDDVELATLEFQFDNGAGAILTTAQAEALIDTLSLFVDTNENGVFDAGVDMLVTSTTGLSLDAQGRMTLVLPDGDPNVSVSAESSRTFFVVVDTAADADLQTPSSFRITHLTESSSTAENRDNDTPLQMEYVANFSSAVLHFTDDPPVPPQPPVPPVVVPPARTTITNSAAHIADATPTIQFAAVADADTYQLVLYSQSLGKELKNVTFNGLEFTSLPLPDDTYEVYVRGINSSGNAPWSAAYVFDLYSAGPGNAPTIYGPHGSILDSTPTIAWENVTGEIDYDVVVYSVDRGVEVAAGTHIEHTYFTTPELAAGETYEVYVRARFAGDALTAWSPMHRFSIVHEAPPTLIAPGPLTTFARPTFAWTAAATAESYTLLVYNVDTGREVERIVGIQQTSAQLAHAYYGATLEAYVRIETASGPGAWSAPLRVKSLAIVADQALENVEFNLLDEFKLIDDPTDEMPPFVDAEEFGDAEKNLAKATFNADEIEHVDAALEMWGELEWCATGESESPEAPEGNVETDLQT